MSIYISLRAPYVWAETDKRDGIVNKGSAASLEELILPKRSGPIIGVAPGDSVLTRSTTIPSRRRSKVQAAIPFSLEDSVSEDIDDLHFSILEWTPGGKANVAVIAKQRLRSWTSEFNDAGITLDEIIPEYLLLPLHPQARTTVAQTNDGRLCIREGSYGGLVLDADDANLWWSEIEDKSTAVAVNNVDLARRFVAAQGTMVKEWNIGDNFVEWLAHQSGGVVSANLLTGEYTPLHRQQSNAGLKAAVIVLALGFLLKMGIDGGEYFYLKKKNERLDRQITQIFNWSFPDIPRVVNPRVQMERQLELLQSGNQGSGEFANLLSAVAKAVPATRSNLQEVVFRNKEMTITCSVSDFAGLDRLKKFFESQPGVSVDLISSGSQDNKVSGRFKLNWTQV